MHSMSILSYIKSHSVVSGAVAIFVVVVTIIAGRVVERSKIPQESASNIKNVVLEPVDNFRTDASVVYADGVVESISQADLKSQISAPLLNVYVSIGDYVNKGQTIAELQNADIKAQLEQARASLELAKGQYDTSGVSVESARRSAVDKVRDAYLKADDAVNTQIGQFLFNQGPDTPQLSSMIIDSSLYDKISTRWTDLQSIFRSWDSSVSSITYSSSDEDIDKALTLAQKNLSVVSDFLSSVSLALTDLTNIANENTLAIASAWKTTTSSARNSISNTSAGVTSSQTTLANARSSHSSPAQAQISVAEAGVKNLEAQLAKTVITSPISGKISALPLRSGEFAAPGQLIATVVGSGGLQIKAYVSAEDLIRIKKDTNATIRGNISGVVTSIAPSISQTTKKAEIKISISNPNDSGLVVGESVQAVIKAEKALSQNGEALYTLPIQNVKIVPGEAYVFTVDSENKAQKVPVILGDVKGGFVNIKSGISDGMKIISPVYEIIEGEEVHIKQ